MNKLIDLAKKFETKLGMSSLDKSKSPKNMKKIAKTEALLQKQIKNRFARIAKVYEDVKLKTASGTIPAVFTVCSNCSGRGKVSNSDSLQTVKLASSGQEVPVSVIKKCSNCNGKRVVKIADLTKCSKEDVADREDFVNDKKKNKKVKKAEKAKSKAAKAVAKAEAAHAASKDPESYMRTKAEKKAKKAAEKANKKIEKAKKAAAKAEK